MSYALILILEIRSIVMMMQSDIESRNIIPILIILASCVVIVAGMRAAASILVPFFLSIFIAVITGPFMFWLVKKGVPRVVALVLSIGAVIIAVIVIGGLIGSTLRRMSSDLPAYEVQFRQSIEATAVWLQARGVDTSAMEVSEIFNPGAIMRIVLGGLKNFQKALTNGFLIIMTVAFMLAEATHLREKIRIIAGYRDGSLGGFDRFTDSVNRYLAIKTVISAATGILVALLLLVMGLDYPVLWGLMAFLLNYIPSIGSIIASIPAILLALVQLGLIPAGIIGIGYLAINVILASIIEPRFMGKGLGISTLVVFLSLIFWGWVLGPVGMLLSVPLTMTVKIGLDSMPETRWLSILLGGAPVGAAIEPESGEDIL